MWIKKLYTFGNVTLKSQYKLLQYKLVVKIRPSLSFSLSQVTLLKHWTAHMTKTCKELPKCINSSLTQQYTLSTILFISNLI